MNIHSLALKIENDKLMLLDQQLLPHSETWIEIQNVDQMISAIQALKVRGAPLIGVAAALALAQSARNGKTISELQNEAQALYKARPTAVNLMNCITRMQNIIHLGENALVQEALQIFHEDVALCKRIAEHGQSAIQNGDNVLTHCNTGGLATAGVGTALGVIRHAFESGKKIHVYVDETRPLLQGGRLTTWELKKLGIPYTLIADNMAGFLMAQGKISKIIVGADRIAANGDFANKIGTYSVAVLAQHHQIPFYVAAPWTTVDLKCKTGKEIPIEERSAKEIMGYQAIEWVTSGSKVYNPAFDVTPAALISGWILDRGFSTEFAQLRDL